MSFADKNLTCRDCGRAFAFTAGEQEFFNSRGFTNEPGRCPDCRSAYKAARGSSGGGFAGGGTYTSGGYSTGGYSSGGYERGERQMFSVTCSSCGNEARVPFQPRGDKPVYCSDLCIVLIASRNREVAAVAGMVILAPIISPGKSSGRSIRSRAR